jgi:hypothetical protein
MNCFEEGEERMREMYIVSTFGNVTMKTPLYGKYMPIKM